MPYHTFTINELCAYLHLEHSDIQWLVRNHGIPFELRGGRLVFNKGDIDAWASQRILGLDKPNLRNYHRTTTAKIYNLELGHAIVSELLKQDTIEPAMPARTKPSVLRHMVNLAEKTGLVGNPADLLQSLEERENLCSTALADGIALLHPRQHEPFMFEDSFIVLGKAAHPLPFGALDGKMSDIFFLICCQDDRIHLHVLARICMMCKETRLLSDIRTADDPATIAQAVRRSEAEVIRRA